MQPWSYLLEIISETSIADPDVQSKALSLINKVLHHFIFCHCVTLSLSLSTDFGWDC